MYLGKYIIPDSRTRTKSYIRRLCFCISALLFCTWSTIAQSQGVSVQLPSTVNSGARDRVVSPDRFECEMAIQGKAQFEYGVAATNSQSNNFIGQTNNNGTNLTAYGKIVIPIGAPKTRLDCNRLYELELRKRELEIKLLEMQTNPDNFRAAEAPPTGPSVVMVPKNNLKDDIKVPNVVLRPHEVPKK